jgi:hypothetical protein
MGLGLVVTPPGSSSTEGDNFVKLSFGTLRER